MENLEDSPSFVIRNGKSRSFSIWHSQQQIFLEIFLHLVFTMENLRDFPPFGFHNGNLGGLPSFGIHNGNLRDSLSFYIHIGKSSWSFSCIRLSQWKISDFPPYGIRNGKSSWRFSFIGIHNGKSWSSSIWHSQQRIFLELLHQAFRIENLFKDFPPFVIHNGKSKRFSFVWYSKWQISEILLHLAFTLENFGDSPPFGIQDGISFKLFLHLVFTMENLLGAAPLFGEHFIGNFLQEFLHSANV